MSQTPEPDAGRQLRDEERAYLEQLSHRIVRAGRRKAIIGGIIAGVVFMLLQTAVILGAARWTGGEGQALADRVDRNAAFTACILTIRPDDRDRADVRGCLEWANQRFATSQPPELRFISPPPPIGPNERGEADG